MPTTPNDRDAGSDLVADPARAAELRAGSASWPDRDLDAREVDDLELLLSGACAPLTGYLDAADLAAVCADGRLADGTPWPVPLTLGVGEELAERLAPGDVLGLRDPEGVLLAVLHVTGLFRPDPATAIRPLFAAVDAGDPGAAVGRVGPPGVGTDRGHPVRVAGRLEGLQLPHHLDRPDLRPTPTALRDPARAGAGRRALWSPDGPPTTARLAAARSAADAVRTSSSDSGGTLVVAPLVGGADPVDADHHARIRAWEAAVADLPPGTAELALLPIAPRGSAGRDLLWQAHVAARCGIDLLLVEPPSGPLGAVDLPALADAARAATGVEVVAVEGADAGDADLADLLDAGTAVPPAVAPAAVSRELRAAHRPRAAQGCTVFFTGLSGSGKSTVARALVAQELARGTRTVTLLDGDLVRKHLSSELGFSQEHRDLNVRRIGWVAAEVTRHGGLAVCCPIAPYDSVRREVRSMVEARGGFVLVHVATPVEECERRDRKGLYAKARAGLLPGFTGVSDPYEEPTDAEVVIDTTDLTPDEAVGAVVAHLRAEGWLA